MSKEPKLSEVFWDKYEQARNNSFTMSVFKQDYDKLVALEAKIEFMEGLGLFTVGSYNAFLESAYIAYNKLGKKLGLLSK